MVELRQYSCVRCGWRHDDPRDFVSLGEGGVYACTDCAPTPRSGHVIAPANANGRFEGILRHERDLLELQRDKLMAEHPDEYVLFRFGQAHGFYPTHAAAYNAGLDRFGVQEPFLVYYLSGPSHWRDAAGRYEDALADVKKAITAAVVAGCEAEIGADDIVVALTSLASSAFVGVTAHVEAVHPSTMTPTRTSVEASVGESSQRSPGHGGDSI